MMLNQAMQVLRENGIEFTTRNGFAEFHYTSIVFPNKRIGNKALKVLFGSNGTLTSEYGGGYGIRFFN